MTKRRSIAEARQQLPTLVREAESGWPIELTRRGEPVAVLVGRRQFDRLTRESRGFSDAYAAFLRAHDLRGLEIDPDRVFADVRGEAGGREVDW